MKRRPELDGIRGAAILLVLIWHYLVVPSMNSSNHWLRLIARLGLETWSGVDLFFVLSGFLIGGILIDAKGSGNFFSTFYIRRIFRILPIYIALCASFPLWKLLFERLGICLSTMPWYVYAAFAENFWLMHHDWNVWLSQAWSLAVEEQFYLTLPLLIWLIPTRHVWKVALAIITATCLIRSGLYLHFYPNWRNAAYILIFCRPMH
jgi:peptidoglycan/LPS O-acetylase OafA/YrhL